jgi:hypothetical protein
MVMHLRIQALVKTQFEYKDLGFHEKSQKKGFFVSRLTLSYEIPGVRGAIKKHLRETQFLSQGRCNANLAPPET